jgi:hypothetical protein
VERGVGNGMRDGFRLFAKVRGPLNMYSLGDVTGWLLCISSNLLKWNSASRRKIRHLPPGVFQMRNILAESTGSSGNPEDTRVSPLIGGGKMGVQWWVFTGRQTTQTI